MGKTPRNLSLTLLIAALLPLSCATQLAPPDAPSSLGGENSLIFGKVVVTVNDKPVNPKPSILQPVIQCHISPCTPENTTNGNLFGVGKYFFNIPISTNGYFSFVMPPGKYYFVSFDYIWLLSAHPNFDVKTYTPEKHFGLTFDVPVNRATYIGTIRNDLQVQGDNAFSLSFRAQAAFSITNQFREAEEWLKKSYPDLATNVVQQEINITNF